MLNCVPDTHCHSCHSFDSETPVRAMMESALQKKLTHVCITDHCDTQFLVEHRLREEIPAMYREVNALREEAAANGLRFMAGVELGQPYQAPEYAREVLAMADWDLVIGSLHNLRGKDDFYWLDYTKEDVPALLDRYFEEQLEMIAWDDFDTLAHLTYPLRYIKKYNIPVSLDAWEKPIETVLRELVKAGKALEVNVSGWRQGMGEPLPGGKWLAMYKALGGTMVTLGSDAHTAEDLGADITRGIDLLREVGFAGVTVFEKRKPVLYPFE